MRAWWEDFHFFFVLPDEKRKSSRQGFALPANGPSGSIINAPPWQFCALAPKNILLIAEIQTLHTCS
jgi:hypothetical protein